MKTPRPRFTGIIPPVCTPLTPELGVDVASLRRLVEHLVGAGVDGLFVLGSTSEVAFLTAEQRAQVAETVVESVSGRVPVLAGVIDMTTPRVIEHAETAAKIGVDAMVATAPFYTRTHPAEIARHFRLLHDAVDLPIFAYDLPVSVHSKLDGAMLLDLAADGVLCGVKDSSGDDAGLRNLLVQRADRGADVAGFSVLTGSETTVDAALAMGVDGAVPGLANVDPEGYVQLLRTCRDGDWVTARTQQERLLRLMRLVDAAPSTRMGRGSSALGAFKAALKLRGVIACAATAPPQIPLDDAEIAFVRAHLIEAGLL
ncbi:dihydrodipicolinate synthase family protein [Nocardioides sp. DS6]|uniref:Dihydrodipicolinate synthase family protein n=1 Tax=Nocardioides eburneus TaxID=3231482 RepID=A0ABV3SXW3_9ACTN